MAYRNNSFQGAPNYPEPPVYATDSGANGGQSFTNFQQPYNDIPLDYNSANYNNYYSPIPGESTFNSTNIWTNPQYESFNYNQTAGPSNRLPKVGYIQSKLTATAKEFTPSNFQTISNNSNDNESHHEPVRTQGHDKGAIPKTAGNNLGSKYRGPNNRNPYYSNRNNFSKYPHYPKERPHTVAQSSQFQDERVFTNSRQTQNSAGDSRKPYYSNSNKPPKKSNYSNSNNYNKRYKKYSRDDDRPPRDDYAGKLSEKKKPPPQTNQYRNDEPKFSVLNRNENRYYNRGNKYYGLVRNTQNTPNLEKNPSVDRKVPPKTDVSQVSDSNDSDCESDGVDDRNQRDGLVKQIANGELECMICCERVKQEDSVWSCKKCFHILHFKCLCQWAESSKATQGWRCPACQHVYSEIPSIYYCFCGREQDPAYSSSILPHSCGKMCLRKNRGTLCIHPCPLECHPGPCPPCSIIVDRSCACGKKAIPVVCNHERAVSCGSICDKLLNCGIHRCTLKCHAENCQPCNEKVNRTCYCERETKVDNCSEPKLFSDSYSCSEVCDQLLNCGNHKCTKLCHFGACHECEFSVTKIRTCYCGQTPLNSDQVRKSCMDPIPCCDKICSKRLKCGQPHSPHLCSKPCHEEKCPPCDLTTLVRCRCGHMDREIPCNQLTGRADDARCEKRCNKKRSCGKHKCNALCCIDIDHECPLICNRMLSCGLHRCEMSCHKGRCSPCYQSSFEELYCECGASVIFPPVPCGTRRPECTQPCSRVHNCEHQVFHNCHSEPECPPCTVLTHKWCFGKHEMRKTIPCHQESFSCGLPCGKELSCGRHKCIAVCHEGPCLSEGKTCTQPCTTPRSTCGHPCGVPCHSGPCPDTPCKETVKVTCQCGHRSTTKNCVDNIREYQRIATAMLANKIADMQLGASVDIGDIVGNQAKRQSMKFLECNDECKVIERNRKLAIGLQIRNPDLSAKLTPRYSDFLKNFGKKDARFCQRIHDKLTELVQLAKQSKQKSRSHSFECMNREKRQFVHEYCEHFGCESVAYDQEPNRNVVATATRDKAWLPSYSLLEIIQRESGQRKVPGPVLRTTRPTTTQPTSSQSVSIRLSNRDSTSTRFEAPPSLAPAAATAPEEEIDYFNNPPV